MLVSRDNKMNKTQFSKRVYLLVEKERKKRGKRERKKKSKKKGEEGRSMEGGKRGRLVIKQGGMF